MKKRRIIATAAALTLAGVTVGVQSPLTAAPPEAFLVYSASYNSDVGEAGSEIVTYDETTKTMLVTNGALNRIDIVSISDPSAPTLVRSVELSPYGSGVQSVAAHKGVGVAVVAGATVLDAGQAVFFEIANGSVYSTQPTGVLPDSVTWSKEGDVIVIPNEGEPRCVTGASRTATRDPLLAENPEGSITVIHVTANSRKFDTHQIGFGGYNSQMAGLQAAGVRVGTWPGSTVAQDLEPEYAAISGDTAYVTLQENNAIAVVDLKSNAVTAIRPLGLKDHSLSANKLDASDRDAGYNLQAWPVKGIFQPDAIDTVHHKGQTYLVTANEGDTRAYYAGIGNIEVAGQECFVDEVRVRSLPGLDPASFGGAANVALLRDNANLGRLKVSTVAPSTKNSSGLYTSLASFGGRSFSVRDAGGSLVWDSASLFESTVNAIDGGNWPSAGPTAPWATAPYDTRSDDKGPEPEAIAVGEHKGRTYGFVGLERAGGVMLFDLTDPTAPRLLQWLRVPGDISPEGIMFVPASKSPNNKPLVLVAHEISGTTSVLELAI